MKMQSKQPSIREDLIGLDVGEHFLCAAHYRRHRGPRPRLHKAGIMEVKPGASDVEISRALRMLWRRAGFHTYTVAVCFRSPATVIKNCRFPSLNDSELAAAIQVEAEISLQRTADAIQYDWLEGPGGDTNHREGILAAAPRREVERQVSILQNAGLYPVIMDAPSLAVAELQRAAQETRSESLCLIQVALHHLEVAILYPDDSLYVRSIYARSLTEDNGIEIVLEALEEEIRYTAFTLRKPAIDRVLFLGFPGSEERSIQAITESTGLAAERWDPLAEVACPSRLARRLKKQVENVGSVMAVALSLGTRRFQ